MSRPRRSTLVDTLIDVSALMPYWLNILLAWLCFFILHRFADLAPQAGSDLDQLGAVFLSQAVRGFSLVGQIIVPFCLLIGALVSALRKNRRQHLFDATTAGGQQESIASLTWREFEQFVTEYFSRQGFTTRKTPDGPDGGVDISLQKEGKNYIVQCKQWRKQLVGVTTVREQFGIMHHLEADGAFIVTSGEFTEEALRFARGKPLMLVGGAELQRRLADLASPPAGRFRRLLPVFAAAFSLLVLIALTVDLYSLKNTFRDKSDTATETAAGISRDNADSPRKGPRPVEPYMVPTPVQPDTPGAQTQYTYSYQDQRGIFQTITSPEKLDYHLVNGRPYYSGTTGEGKRLAAFLNQNRPETHE